MSVFQANYFDGKSALRHPVSVIAAGGRLKVVGRDVALELDARLVRRSLRVGNTPRWLYLPGGGACVTDDNGAVDRITRTRRYERLLNLWESRSAYAAVAVLLVVAAAWLLLDRGVPAAAELIAERIPIDTEVGLGNRTLQSLEQYLMGQSTLPSTRQTRLRAKLAALAEKSDEPLGYRIEFRASPRIGPNAFALPGGVIVVTDELVQLAQRDDEVLAVLAHELGHVRHRHVMRRLIESSVAGLVIAGITGDVASAASLGVAAPALLLQAKYSRGNEREADAFAISLMQKSGINPRHFAAILARMEEKADRRSGIPGFLASHPGTEERRTVALTAAGDKQVDKAEDAEPEPLPQQLAETDGARKEVAALLGLREFEALDRLFAGHQAQFEQNADAFTSLERAYPAFRNLPEAMLAPLVEWRDMAPASYAARVALGNYYFQKAREARGGAYRHLTPRANFERMDALLAKARAELDASMKLAAKPYMSHFALVEIARIQGRDQESAGHYAAALVLAPQSSWLRLERMSQLEPRWGGSYAAMEAHAAQAKAQLKDPKAAARIVARVPAYRAEEQQHEKNYARALPLYDEAISISADADILCNRSFTLASLNRYNEAFADVRLALSKRRDIEYCHDRAIWAVGKVDDWKGIVEVMSIVIESSIHLGAAYRERGWAQYELKNIEQSTRDYEAGAKLGDSEAQLQLGRYYLHGTGVKQDREQARAWLRKSLSQGNIMAKRVLEEMKADDERRR